MADSREDEEIRRMVADFNAAVEELRREGVPADPPRGGRTPWAEARRRRSSRRSSGYR
jgi:hypothetical protein